MFEIEEIRRIVDLQQKSYGLLKWVGDALRAGTLSFGTVHEATTLSEAALDWLGRQEASLPVTLRPDIADREAFVHLFVSYLTTSYRLEEEPGSVRLPSRRGCYCRFCSYLASANYLRLRIPDKKATLRAREMKHLYLSALAEEVGIDLLHEKREQLILHPTLAESVSYATYGTELLRRSRFASQGEGVLVLWREIAWKNGKLKKGFALSPERIIASEKSLVAFLQ